MLTASWHVFEASAIYMLFGFFFAGVLYVFIKPETIGRYLGKGRIRSVFLSALAGIPIPLCSCGVVPAAAGLKKQGANNGATLSFLISTPESGVDSIPLTYALMDPVITLIRPVSAFITAIVAGITENFFNRSADGVSNPPSPVTCATDGDCGCSNSTSDNNKPTKNSMTAKIMAGLKYAFVDLLGDIGKWFLVGIFLAGLITYFIPDNVFESYLSNNFIAMLVMLAVGMPMYVCATSSTPIAAALVLKGLNPGAALVFLLAGPATNIASLSMVSGLLGRRSLFIYLGSIAVCSLTLGLLTDLLYFGIGISAKATAGQFSEIFPHQIELAGAAVLTALLLFAFYHSFKGHTSCA
ncbi:SO_0444 family Cu/Zn efflux transporter [Thermodesulfobacteriota bacterium]